MNKDLVHINHQREANDLFRDVYGMIVKGTKEGNVMIIARN
jgi:hypothetical protein